MVTHLVYSAPLYNAYGCINSGVLEVKKCKVHWCQIEQIVKSVTQCTTHGVKEPHPTTHGVREDAI